MYVVYTILDAQAEQYSANYTAADDPPAYRERLAGMQSDAARARTRTGIRLLAYTLKAIGEPAGALAAIGLSASGRPRIEGVPEFSISHSDALVACAIADDNTGRCVGLDVEARRPIDVSRMARLMSAQERCVVADEPTRFFDFWCAREATVKASGRVGLKRIREIELGTDHARLDGHSWPIAALALAPGYAACLASDEAFETPRIEQVVWDGRAAPTPRPEQPG